MVNRLAHYALIALIVVASVLTSISISNLIIICMIVFVGVTAILLLHRRRQRWLRLYIKMYMDGLIRRDVQ